MMVVMMMMMMMGGRERRGSNEVRWMQGHHMGALCTRHVE
jgi:hypothetical protein